MCPLFVLSIATNIKHIKIYGHILQSSNELLTKGKIPPQWNRALITKEDLFISNKTKRIMFKWTDDDTTALTTESPEVLLRLSTSDDFQVRASVAWNQHTPPGLLSDLARDNNLTVRCEVANNPNTPLQTMERLARDEIKVRRNLAFNSNLPPEIVALLSTDTDETIRFGLQKRCSDPNRGFEFDTVCRRL